jgi:hypothetical protein
METSWTSYLYKSIEWILSFITIQSDMKETLLEEKKLNEELKSNLEIQKKLLEEMKDYFKNKN